MKHTKKSRFSRRAFLSALGTSPFVAGFLPPTFYSVQQYQYSAYTS